MVVKCVEVASASLMCVATCLPSAGAAAALVPDKVVIDMLLGELDKLGAQVRLP